MKFLICFLAAFAIAASAELKVRDLSHVRHISERFLGPRGFDPLTGFVPQGDREGRITNGQEAVPNSIPFQLALFINLPPPETGAYFCGASLISAKTVLTAAHCADLLGIGIEVIAGAHNIRNFESTQQTRWANESLGQVLVHENWDASALTNDIALLTVTPFELNINVAIVRLPSFSESSTWSGLIARVSGWGRREGQSGISEVLHHVSNTVMTNLNCNTFFPGIIGASKLCVSGSGGMSSCNGDSGGPLVVPEDDGIHTEIGVVSFGIALGCTIGFPHAYTRTTFYLGWIAANTDDVQIRP